LLSNYLADPVEMKLLHMVTADPNRTPTFTRFAKSDYYVFAGASNRNAPCVQEAPAFAWNHGGVAPDVNVTFLGLVGQLENQLTQITNRRGNRQRRLLQVP